MKKNHLIIASTIGVALIIAFLFILPKDRSRDLLTVVSDDGKAELEIPISALPEGTNIDDISITKISADNIDGDEASDKGSFAYRLEPDGLEFGEEVFLTVDYVNVDGGIPLVYQVLKNGSIEVIDKVELIFDEDNKVTMVAPIRHFSELAGDPIFFGVSDFRAVHRASPYEVCVGDPISSSLTINKDDEVVQYYSVFRPGGTSLHAAKIVPGSVFISGSQFPNQFPYTVPEPIISPQNEIHDLPPLTPFDQSSITIPVQNHSCASPGTARIGVGVEMQWTQEDYVRETATEEFKPRTWAAREYSAGMIYIVTADCKDCSEPNEVEMLMHEGMQLPFVQFRVAAPDACGQDHYHPIGDTIAYTRNEDAVLDPASRGCGFGEVLLADIDHVIMEPHEIERLNIFLLANGKPPILIR